MNKEYMLIGEIAEFFNVSRKAIRLYEKKNIIKQHLIMIIVFKQDC